METPVILLRNEEVGRLRLIVQEWNKQHGELELPWEWVEEAALARLRYATLQDSQPAEAEAQFHRLMEFDQFLPWQLRTKLFRNGVRDE